MPDSPLPNLFTTVYADKFLPLILPYAVACPNPVAEQYVRLAAIEFCERTRAWRYIVEMAVDSTNETIVAPDYATIHEIENAWWNGEQELEPTQFTEVAPQDMEPAAPASSPRYITQVNPNKVTVIPYAEGTLRLSLFLKPRSGSAFGQDAGNTLRNYYNQVPEFLWTQHAEDIANGALARILAIPDQPYSDARRALYYAEKFNAALNRKFSNQIRGQQRARRRTKIQFC